MGDSFLDKAGGYTPVPDKLVRNKNYGFEGAYLWGRIRRLCQIGKGSYTISHEELGKRIGMSRRTVIKYLDRLIEDGYVEDLTPGVRNKAHTYSVKNGEAKILSGMQISHTESDMTSEDKEVSEPEGKDVGMRNLHSEDAEIAHQDDTGMQDLHTEYAEIAQPGMQNLHLKRDSLETIKETTTKEIAPPPKSQRAIIIPAYKVFVEVTDYYAITKHWRGEMARIVGETTEDLEFWRLVVIGWTGKYPSRHNVEGMLDYYKRREIPGYSGNGAMNNGHPNRSQTNTGDDPALETGGTPTIAAQLTAAWERKARGSRSHP